jgi:hypothetical protein
MQALRDWSLWRILLASGAWVVLAAFLTVAWGMWQVYRIQGEMAASGSGGIGAVSVGFLDWPVLLVVLPPIMLFIAWVTVRWFGR